MFAYEAAALLKSVLCPICKKDIASFLGSPFHKFNSMEICAACPTKRCRPFLEEVNTRFQSYEAGKINAADFQQWLQGLKV